MLADAWNEFVTCTEARIECSVGAALSTLVHASELGHRTRHLVHAAVLSGRALHDPISAETTRILRRFIFSRNLREPDPVLECVLDVMTRIAQSRPILPGVQELEWALRESLRQDEACPKGLGAVTG
tara:strand:+ start:2126 stop:2506 length:381 start_codon:yes stop_codon:yes gene_type:complete